jgi:hypothetical protein
MKNSRTSPTFRRYCIHIHDLWVNQTSSQEKYKLLIDSVWLLDCLILWPWRWKQIVPPKRRWTVRPHGVIELWGPQVQQTRCVVSTQFFMFALSINRSSRHECSSIGPGENSIQFPAFVWGSVCWGVRDAIVLAMHESNHVNGRYFQDVHPRVHVVQPWILRVKSTSTNKHNEILFFF